MNTASKSELVAAMNVLVRRRGNTSDEAEKAVINASLTKLSGWIQDIDQAVLLDAARIVADATDELELVVASARTGPFDNFLADIQAVIGRLQNLLAQMHASEGLASANRGTMPRGTARAEGAPINSKVFADLADEYQRFFDRCELRSEKKGNVEFYVSRLQKFKQTYQDTGAPLGIPWWFIGIIHGMECGFNFTTHLHNGDPLTKRTVQVPKGRPAAGAPPFTWRESARDALMLDGYHHETQWSVPRALFLWEKYNGFGYRRRGVPSPYLWSFSNIYTAGKFTSDGSFDVNAVSKQCGTALMLKQLTARGLL